MQSPQSSGDATVPPRRPSLVGDAAVETAERKQLSILAALDGHADGGAGPLPHRIWPWAVGLGTVAVALLATVLLGHTDDGAISHMTASNSSAPRPLPPTPGTPAPAPAAALPAAVPASQLAALEILAAAPLVSTAPTVNAMPAAPASAPTPAAISTSKTPKDSGARNGGAKRVSGNGQQAKAPTIFQGSSATRAVAKTSPSATRPTARPVNTAPTATQAAARGGDDADVDLIAALMQHLNRQGSPDGAVPTTIADLVGRCKGLSVADAQRCQRRICDNYWGRAEACPRHLAPRELAVRP